MKIGKMIAAVFLAIALSIGCPGFHNIGFQTVAEAGVVSKTVKLIAAQMFGRILLRQGGKVLRQELLAMIRKDPKILEHLVAKGIKWVKKNPKLKSEYDKFVAEAKAFSKYDRRVEVSRTKYPESAKHIDDAVDAGHPRALDIYRPGAQGNRRDSMPGNPPKKGYDRDEYPPAMTREGGKGASVRYIDPSDNRGAGSCIRWQCVDLPNGARILLDTVD